MGALTKASGQRTSEKLSWGGAHTAPHGSDTVVTVDEWACHAQSQICQRGKACVHTHRWQGLSFRDLLSLTPVLPPPDAHRLLRPMIGVVTVVKLSPELHIQLILSKCQFI